MEEKLAAYRAQKRKEELFPAILKKVKDNISLTNYQGSSISESEEEHLIPRERLQEDESTTPIILHKSTLLNNSDAELIEDPDGHLITCPNTSWLDILTYVLYFSLWVTLYAITIHLEFGMVFLIVSLLYFLWSNTRTGPKKKGEVSAYSVFNRNCEAIDGAISADQFEREIRYGPTSIR